MIAKTKCQWQKKTQKRNELWKTLCAYSHWNNLCVSIKFIWQLYSLLDAFYLPFVWLFVVRIPVCTHIFRRAVIVKVTTMFKMPFGWNVFSNKKIQRNSERIIRIHKQLEFFLQKKTFALYVWMWACVCVLDFFHDFKSREKISKICLAGVKIRMN